MIRAKSAFSGFTGCHHSTSPNLRKEVFGEIKMASKDVSLLKPKGVVGLKNPTSKEKFKPN
jgi:hypothetical protein